MAVTKRTRFEVMKRDNYTCRYCRNTDNPLTIDHVIPVALGGTDNPDNLVTCCIDCNAGKASSNPDAELVEDVKQADMKWAGAMKRAAEIRAAERDLELVYVNAFEEVWQGCYWRPDTYGDSLVQMRTAGLPVDEMREAALIALTNRGIEDRWRYFCGVAWRKVAKLQEIAKSLLEADEAGVPDGS